MTSIGDELRRRRRARGLSQEQLGREAGLSGRFVSGLERGEAGQGIRAVTLYHLARALGTRMEVLLGLPPLLGRFGDRRADSTRKP